MNTNRNISNFLRLIVASSIAATASAAMAQGAQADKCAPRMSGLEHRLYQKTGEGPDALRDFIFIRRGIYQLDMIDVQMWARGVDAIRATCMKTVAADPAPTSIAVIADLH